MRHHSPNALKSNFPQEKNFAASNGKDESKNGNFRKSIDLFHCELRGHQLLSMGKYIAKISNLFDNNFIILLMLLQYLFIVICVCKKNSESSPKNITFPQFINFNRCKFSNSLQKFQLFTSITSTPPTRYIEAATVFAK